VSEKVAIELPPEPASAGRARDQLRGFRGSLDETSFIDLCLLVDELVVEALKGGGGEAVGPIEMRADDEGDRIRVQVAEGSGAYRLPSRRPEPGDPGFGLHLVQRLSDRWGMQRDQERATVWLEIGQGPRRVF
jgi:two-component sensor histidine kinase